MKLRIACLGLLLGAAGFAATPVQQETISWAKTYEDGGQEATIRNVPILFTAHKDG